jgi:hypothetical protein
MKMLGTPGVQVVLPDGSTVLAGPDGVVDVPPVAAPALLTAGFIQVPDAIADSTSGRPSQGVVPGMMVLDTTLNKPIWRNPANTAWIDATGATV